MEYIFFNPNIDKFHNDYVNEYLKNTFPTNRLFRQPITKSFEEINDKIKGDSYYWMSVVLPTTLYELLMVVIYTSLERKRFDFFQTLISDVYIDMLFEYFKIMRQSKGLSLDDLYKKRKNASQIHASIFDFLNTHMRYIWMCHYVIFQMIHEIIRIEHRLTLYHLNFQETMALVQKYYQYTPFVNVDGYENIILRCINLNYDININDIYLLYRSSNIFMNSSIETYFEYFASSISYGQTLFSGLFFDPDACPLTIFINTLKTQSKTQYLFAYKLSKHPFTDDFMYIPPLNTFLTLWRKGEYTHPRSKIIMSLFKEDQDVRGLDPSVSIDPVIIYNCKNQEVVECQRFLEHQILNLKRDAILIASSSNRSRSDEEKILMTFQKIQQIVNIIQSIHPDYLISTQMFSNPIIQYLPFFLQNQSFFQHKLLPPAPPSFVHYLSTNNMNVIDAIYSYLNTNPDSIYFIGDIINTLVSLNLSDIDFAIKTKNLNLLQAYYPILLMDTTDITFNLEYIINKMINERASFEMFHFILERIRIDDPSFYYKAKTKIFKHFNMNSTYEKFSALLNSTHE
jgi:hypothetical protein